MRDTCEDQLTYSECFKVLSTFRNDQTPGNDRLETIDFQYNFPGEFYKFFCSEMGTFALYYPSKVRTYCNRFQWNMLLNN